MRGRLFPFLLGLSLGLALSWTNVVQALADIINGPFFHSHGMWFMGVLCVFALSLAIIYMHHKMMLFLYNHTNSMFESGRRILAKEVAYNVLIETGLLKKR